MPFNLCNNMHEINSILKKLAVRFLLCWQVAERGPLMFSAKFQHRSSGAKLDNSKFSFTDKHVQIKSCFSTTKENPLIEF